MQETWLRVLGWAGNALLFSPFKIMRHTVPLSDFSRSDPFSGKNQRRITRVKCISIQFVVRTSGQRLLICYTYVFLRVFVLHHLGGGKGIIIKPNFLSHGQIRTANCFEMRSLLLRIILVFFLLVLCMFIYTAFLLPARIPNYITKQPQLIS